MQSSKPSTTSTRSLTKQQLQLLITLYKFRFVTAELIAKSQNAKHKRVILVRLKILEDQGYIGKNYNKSYKLIGKPASYYLLPKGIQALRKQPSADEKVLKRLYYDKNQDDVHINHRLNVFRAYVYLKQNYPDRFTFFSKTELSTWKHVYIPRDLTDGYIKRNTSPELSEDPTKPKLTAKHYFVSYYEAATKPWRIRNSISRYIAYAESEKWQKATKHCFPVVLMICENEKQANRLEKIAEQKKETSWAIIKFVPFILNS